MTLRVLLLLSLLLNGFWVLAETNDLEPSLSPTTSINIVLADHVVPYSFVDNNGHLQGLLVDYWKLWATKNHHKINFIVATPKTRHSKNNTKINSKAYPSRSFYGGMFSPIPIVKNNSALPIMLTTKYQLFLRQDSSHNIKSITDFANATVGIIGNDFDHEFIKNNFPSITMKSYLSIDQLINAIELGDIDVFFFESAIAWRYLTKVKLKSAYKTLPGFAVTNYIYPQMVTYNQPLAKLIKTGMAKISAVEIYHMSHRWLNESAELATAKAQNASNQVPSFFNRAQLQYIRTHPILRVGVSPWAPIIYSDDGITIKGVIGDYIHHIAEVSGLQLQVVRGNWIDLIKQFNQREIDLLPATYLNAERTKQGLFGEPHFKARSSIYTLQQNTEVASMADLNFLSLAITAGDATVKNVKQLYPNINIVRTKNTADSLAKLISKEVSAVFEIDAVMAFQLQLQNITNVKSIQQSDFSAKSLHFFSTNNQPLLQSILNKSLASLTPSNRDNIIKQWLNKGNHKKSINIAFGLGREPYGLNPEKSLFTQNFVQGIEFDLIKQILNLGAIETNSITKLPINDLPTALTDHPQVDMVVTVKKQADDFYYSDDFIGFNNVAITRVADKLSIFDISDLLDLNVLAFSGASQFLGPQFNKSFNNANRPASYAELAHSDVAYQQKQIAAIVAGKADVIILDLTIFKWYIKQTGYNAMDHFVVHTIFPQANKFQVGFRDKALRDIFNYNLNKIKVNGQYDYTIADYGDGYISQKTELTSLIAAIAGKLIFDNSDAELSTFTDRLATLPYINKIEIFNNNDRLLYSTSTTEYKFYNELDSFYLMSGINLQAGRVRIYFNDPQVERHLLTEDLIPEIDFFKNSHLFKYISKVYRRFNFLDSKVFFSPAERAYLDSKPILKYTDIDWRPLSIVKNGVHTGLIADYITLISDITGIKFDFVPLSPWSTIIKAFNSKQLDLLFTSHSLSAKLDNPIASTEYANFKLAIVMQKNSSFVAGVEDLRDKTLAIPEGFTSHHYLKNQPQEFNIITTATVFEALTLVSQGKADAFIGHFAVVVHQLEQYFSQLKIVGLINHDYSHRLILHKSNFIAMSSINKALRSITPQQHQQIKQRWIKTQVSTAVDYRLVYQIIGIFIVILIFVSSGTKRISLAKREVEQANKEMKETVTALEEQKNTFETLFYDASDGLLLMIQDMFIDCNNAAINMLGFSSKSDLLNSRFLDFSPQVQPNGQLSSLQYLQVQEYFNQYRHHQFEWLFNHKNGQSLWVEIILTTISLNNQDVMHIVWRDISDKKLLEGQILKRNEELESKNYELKKVIDELHLAQDKLVASEKMASLGGLVAGIAHEVNTPVGIGLTASSLFMDMTAELETKYLAQKMSNAYFAQYLAKAQKSAHLIHRNLERTAELVASFKQISVDQSSDERRSFNVRNYIDGILLSTHHIIRNSNLKIAVSCPDKLIINSYPGAFSQILSNLLINSNIHGYPNKEIGLITITIDHNDNSIVIIYQDDGCGISTDNIKKIFDPFFTTNREHGGSGLGLNIIYNIVTNRLKGKIECQSEVGRGTKFTIKFDALVRSL